MLQKARMSSNSAVKNNITSITTRPHTKTLHSRYINEYVAMPIDTNLDNMIVLRANWAAFLLNLAKTNCSPYAGMLPEDIPAWTEKQNLGAESHLLQATNAEMRIEKIAKSERKAQYSIIARKAP